MDAAIGTIIAGLLATFKDSINIAFSNVKEEYRLAFGEGLKSYIESFYDKFLTTKTFLHRDNKIDFYDTFFPVRLLDGRGHEINSNDFQNLFDESKYITLIGKAGSGKSIIMKHIFLSSIHTKFKLPILVELRNLNDSEDDLMSYISEIILSHKITTDTKLVERILRQGNFIFLLDGYDEIFSIAKNKVSQDIENFIDLYHQNHFVITSRPGANAESIQRTNNLYLQDLSDEEMESFIKLQFKNHENAEHINKIYSTISIPENADYRKYLSNPLLLSMFLFTYNNYPELPRTKSKFYSNVFETLCTKHDSFTKTGFWLHERQSKLQHAQLENILKWLCYTTILKGRYNFDYEFLSDALAKICTKLSIDCEIDKLIYDLTVSVSILIQDGTEFTFPHKSLQEYFSASLIKSLDQEDKIPIYSKLSLDLQKLTHGGNVNFFSLCFELDKKAFCEHFLFFSHDTLLTKIDRSSNETFVKSYFKAFECVYTTMFENKTNSHQIATISFHNWGFIDFLGLEYPAPLFGELRDNDYEVHLTKLINSLGVNFLIFNADHLEDWSEPLEEFFVNSGFIFYFEKTLTFIEKEIDLIKEQMLIELQSKRDLLSLDDLP